MPNIKAAPLNRKMLMFIETVNRPRGLNVSDENHFFLQAEGHLREPVGAVEVAQATLPNTLQILSELKDHRSTCAIPPTAYLKG